MNSDEILLNLCLYDYEPLRVQAFRFLFRDHRLAFRLNSLTPSHSFSLIHYCSQGPDLLTALGGIQLLFGDSKNMISSRIKEQVGRLNDALTLSVSPSPTERQDGQRQLETCVDELISLLSCVGSL